MTDSLVDAALRARADAAVDLLRRDSQVSGAALLAAVVWPRDSRLEQPRTQRMSREEVERVFELRAAGLSPPRIARELGRAKGSIQGLLQIGREEALRRRQNPPAADLRHRS